VLTSQAPESARDLPTYPHRKPSRYGRLKKSQEPTFEIHLRPSSSQAIDHKVLKD